MKRRRSHHSGLRFVVEEKNSPSTYLRLCHRCLFLNESSDNILGCTRCESQFNALPGLEAQNEGSSDWISEEDPIQESIADFESERVDEKERYEGRVSEEDDDAEEEGRLRRSKPISGLSVLW